MSAARAKATELMNRVNDPDAKRLRAMLMVAAVCAVLVLAWLLWWWLLLSQREVTDNAYVAGRQVLVTAQSAGTVVAVLADDTQPVQAGQLLVQLDAADATLALDRARAELAQTVRRVRALRDTADLNEALVSGRRLEMAQAEDDLKRRLPLKDSRAIAPELLAHAGGQLALAQAALLAAQKQSAVARDASGSGSVAEHPAVLSARASYIDAWLGLQRTRIAAPITGTVIQRTAQTGTRVQAGVALMRLVPADQMWIDANLKENQLRNLRIGQPATVTVDLYGGGDRAFKGRVAGFSPGTGSAFALLPPQNAAGNWIKVVQRVPVRIALQADELLARPLLIGLSAQVRIDTGDRSGPRIAPTAAATTEPPPAGQAPQAASREADKLIAAAAFDGPKAQ